MVHVLGGLSQKIYSSLLFFSITSITIGVVVYKSFIRDMMWINYLCVTLSDYKRFYSITVTVSYDVKIC